MNILRTLCAMTAAIFLASMVGCGKPEAVAPKAQLAPSPLSPDTVVRVHWLGKRQLGITASAFTFKRYWDMDQSKQLESRTLDKLSIAPWRLLKGEASITEAPGIVLRSLLDDIVQEECYFEARGEAHKPVELIFAINLNEKSAGLWRTNLALVVGSLTGSHNMELRDRGRSWSIRKQNVPNHIQLVRAGEWTILGLAQDKNTLLDEIVERIRRDHTPFVSAGTNCWLEADIDMNRAPRVLSSDRKPAEGLPHLSFKVTGDGGTVITRGELNFPQSLPGELEPWTIPTDLMHEPLISFTAARGFKEWLGDQKFWADPSPTPPPDQIFFWALEGAPLSTFFATPLPDASNHMHQLTRRLLGQGNSWLTAHDYVGFEPLPMANGVRWGSQSNVLPFLKSVKTEQGDMLFGGLLPETTLVANRPVTEGMIQDVLRRTNLVYYDWELTGPRIDSWMYMGQLIRQVTRHHQLPLESPAAAWLNALRVRLGTSATVITRTETNQLTFVRRSTFGFTAMELHLLADWFESTQFPLGLYSIYGPPSAMPQR